ncbi:MAG: DUF1800 family protein, partial [Proteobacteria bacterium]|nr:DUF1800 family protein [Pseudomonadota bacterium]
MAGVRSTIVLALAALLSGGALLGGCTASASAAPPDGASAVPDGPLAGRGDEVRLLREANRLTWGADSRAIAQLRSLGYQRYVEQQLHPTQAALPPAVLAQIDAMTISQRPMIELAREMAEQRRQAVALTDDDAKKAALKAWQQDMTRLGREAQTREILRALYSPNQVQEEMTWFWMNHFNVFLYKGNIRATIGDYEDAAIRPHALGKFRDLLGAVAHHPAMLVHLDNVQNAAGHVNE